MAVHYQSAVVVEPGIVTVIDRRIDDALTDLEEGEAPPTVEARESCQLHFSRLARFSGDVPAPSVGVPGDGSVFLQWSHRDRVLLATVYPDGSLRQYRGRRSDSCPEDGRVLSNPSPPETLEAIRWVFDPTAT